jgi:hypothetical protein
LDRRSWLDAAVAGIRDRARAREVVEEIDGHLSAIVKELLAAGRTPADAEAEAMRRMGDPERLGRSMAEVVRTAGRPRRRAVAVGAALFPSSGVLAVGLGFVTARYGDAPTWIGAVLVWAMAASAVAGVSLLLGSVTFGHGAFAGTRPWLRRHRGTLGLWALLGLVFELAPGRFAVPALAGFAAWPWQAVGWVSLFAAVMVIVLRTGDLPEALAVLAVAVWTWALAGVIVGSIMARVAPVPPAAFAAVYGPEPRTWLMFFTPWWRVQWVGPVALAGTFAVLFTRAARFALRGVGHGARKCVAAE